jgi:phosphoglycolate phosphatase
VKLVLFDIDGTLLWSDGAGRRSMTAALAETFGTSGPPDYRYDGKTDPQIVHDLMTHAGFGASEIEGRMAPLITRYLILLADELRERRVRLFDGVAELLDAVDADPGMTLGLLTGNVREGAALKLRAAGLDFARFRVGAFGSDHAERPQLPAIAQRRAREALGVDVPGDRVFVIGDTPADIACGRGIGARSIAVATGHYKVEELARHEPAAVFASFADRDAVMRVLRDG